MTIFKVNAIMIGHHHAALLVHQIIFGAGFRISKKKKNHPPGQPLYSLSSLIIPTVSRHLYAPMTGSAWPFTQHFFRKSPKGDFFFSLSNQYLMTFLHFHCLETRADNAADTALQHIKSTAWCYHGIALFSIFLSPWWLRVIFSGVFVYDFDALCCTNNVVVGNACTVKDYLHLTTELIIGMWVGDKGRRKRHNSMMRGAHPPLRWSIEVLPITKKDLLLKFVLVLWKPVTTKTVAETTKLDDASSDVEAEAEAGSGSWKQ